jgi:hypothetical protein
VLAELDDDPVEAGQHVVQFYETDTGLALAVGSFLGVGLTAGETALVVATGAHRALFEASLRHAGIDVDAARAGGQLHLLDAQELLDAFIVDGTPDTRRFDATVGHLVGDLVGCGRPLRIYGEMVALLWDDGNVGAAMQLEELWNDLRRCSPFTLFCAYPRRSISGIDSEAICRSHSAVVAEPQPQPTHADEAIRRFEPTTYAVPVARAFVRDTLTGWGRESLLEVSDLIVSELAANAVRHSSRRFVVTLSKRGAATRIAVSDLSALLPTLRASDPDATDGRGIQLIAAVSLNWGAELHNGAKTVWAEIQDVEAG